MRRRVPMGRLARPDEIARVVSFLASVQACYVTGSVLAVDGGWMSFNQPGDASPEVEGALRTELSRPDERTDARVVRHGRRKRYRRRCCSPFCRER